MSDLKNFCLELLTNIHSLMGSTLLVTGNEVPHDALAAIESSIAKAEENNHRRLEVAQAYDLILRDGPFLRPLLSRMEETLALLLKDKLS